MIENGIAGVYKAKDMPQYIKGRHYNKRVYFGGTRELSPVTFFAGGGATFGHMDTAFAGMLGKVNGDLWSI